MFKKNIKKFIYYLKLVFFKNIKKQFENKRKQNVFREQ